MKRINAFYVLTILIVSFAFVADMSRHITILGYSFIDLKLVLIINSLKYSIAWLITVLLVIPMLFDIFLTILFCASIVNRFYHQKLFQLQHVRLTYERCMRYVWREWRCLKEINIGGDPWGWQLFIEFIYVCVCCCTTGLALLLIIQGIILILSQKPAKRLLDYRFSQFNLHLFAVVFLSL